MTDWEEIKRLAADFQRTQTSDTLQRISERNCIDIVKKLTDLSLIELIYTCDGKEFITPGHLLREIEDEVHFNGGRVHLHDLSTSLNVDYQHVESKARELARDRPDEYNLVLGQIIHKNYKTTLGKQIYDTMINLGQLSIAEFSKSLDLPSEFLISMVADILPTVLDNYVASADGRTYYSTDMMDRYKAIISGTLSAITKPTTMASIMKKLDIPEKMFVPIVDALIKEGRIDAAVENRLFIPAIYAREQNEWIDKFYTTNAYIEYDLLARKDIKQPKAFLRKRFPGGVQLKSCFVSPDLVSQVETMVEDCIASNSLMDISTILPASFQPDDIEELLQGLFKRSKQLSSSCLILHQTNVCSLGYIATCKQSFSNMMIDKAKEHLKEGRLVDYFLGGKVGASRSRQQSENLKEQPDPTEKAAEEEKVIDKSLVQSPQEQKSEKDVSKKVDDIELTAEDLKRGKRQKKGKQQRAVDESITENQDSDGEQPGRKSKGGASGKKGGGAGTQGREIKQKATKKKYLIGKGRHQNEDSDDEHHNVKTLRSNRGRSSKKAASSLSEDSQNLSQLSSSKGSTKFSSRDVTGPGKEPLEFMSHEELVTALRDKSREAGEFADEMLSIIVSMIADELNQNYEKLARAIMDEHLRSKSGSTKGEKDDEELERDEDDIVDLVE